MVSNELAITRFKTSSLNRAASKASALPIFTSIPCTACCRPVTDQVSGLLSCTDHDSGSFHELRGVHNHDDLRVHPVGSSCLWMNAVPSATHLHPSTGQHSLVSVIH